MFGLPIRELPQALSGVITRLLLTSGRDRCSAQPESRACLAGFRGSGSAPASPGRNTDVTDRLSFHNMT